MDYVLSRRRIIRKIRFNSHLSNVVCNSFAAFNCQLHNIFQNVNWELESIDSQEQKKGVEHIKILCINLIQVKGFEFSLYMKMFLNQFLYLQSMKHGHTNLMVCSRVRHKWDTDARWISVRHVSNTRPFVSHLKKYYFSAQICVRYAQTWLEYASDTT